MKAVWNEHVTLPAWLKGWRDGKGVTWQSVRERLQKPQVEGLAALFVTNEGVGLVHVVGTSSGRPELKVCVFQTVSKGQVPGRVAQGLVKSHQLEKARFVGVLDRGSYVIFPAETPDLPREEWAAAMKWRVKDQIQFPVTQAVLELFDMPGGSAGGESGRIYVAAAKDGEIRRHVQLFLDAGVKLLALDIPELALLNLLRGGQGGQEGVALLHLERQSGLVMMVKGGQFYLARRMESGLDALNREGSSLANSSFLDRTALEVQRTMDYYESHFGQGSVDLLQVAPLPILVEGFRQALAERLGMRVHYLNLREFMEIPETLSDEDLARALPSIGAALREVSRGS